MDVITPENYIKDNQGEIRDAIRKIIIPDNPTVRHLAVLLGYELMFRIATRKIESFDAVATPKEQDRGYCQALQELHNDLDSWLGETK